MTREPARGDFGRISTTGMCLSSERQAMAVAPTMPTTNRSTPPIPYMILNCSTYSGSRYIVSKIEKMMFGSRIKPSRSPRIPPIRQAAKAYSKYLRSISRLVKPSAIYVPIKPRSSSTIRVMVVRLIKMATMKKTIGNAVPTASIEEASL